ncbi:MAG TPA: MOSC N-terminal beta barrel domain-containing protein [Candidatus Acidoferrum sp.]|nr:MOSC N-terminal beta barrel domain-containing protein [Candidatus Acidoferrum sp.]
MNGEPYLARIRIFPFKSLSAAERDHVRVLPSGALESDREFALFDRAESVINGKRTTRVHALRAVYPPALDAVTFERSDARFTFRFDQDTRELERWLSAHFSCDVFVRRDRRGGFPDDTDAPGPTIVSTATLETVAGWFSGLDVDAVRERFRANLEIGGVPAFWEDRLYGAPGETIRIAIGEARFGGVNPCQRCIVPSRDPSSGTPTPSFAKIFAERRLAELPPWADRSRFDHGYRLCVNTAFGGAGEGVSLRLGDRVRIVGPSADA